LAQLVPGGSQVELEPGEGVVEAPVDPRRLTGEQLGEHACAVDEPRHVHAGVAQDLPPERVERPNPGLLIRCGQGRERIADAVLQLVRGTSVEGHRRDRPRFDTRRDQPADPSDQRGRLT
jgi:hypothetical protein